MEVQALQPEALLQQAQPELRVAQLQHQLSAAQLQQGQERAEQYWQVAEGFEEIFLNTMLQAMRRTTMPSDVMGDNNETRIYQGMMDQELASTMSKRRSFGISRMMFEWMTRGQPLIQELGLNGFGIVQKYQENQEIDEPECENSIENQ